MVRRDADERLRDRQPSAGCLFLGLLGIGSMLGMVLVSLLLAAPPAVARRRGTWLQRGLGAAAGTASIVIDLSVVVRMVRGGGIFQTAYRAGRSTRARYGRRFEPAPFLV